MMEQAGKAAVSHTELYYPRAAALGLIWVGEVSWRQVPGEFFLLVVFRHATSGELYWGDEIGLLSKHTPYAISALSDLHSAREQDLITHLRRNREVFIDTEAVTAQVDHLLTVLDSYGLKEFPP